MSEDWEAKLATLLAHELRQRRRGKAGAGGRSWFVDETYLEVRGRWCYLYRAIDRHGALIDTMLSEHRDMAAATAFFRSAKSVAGMSPDRVTTDGQRILPQSQADGQLPADTTLRSSKYLNNLIEQDHRGTKLRIGPMLGFKWFKTAAVTIAGLELLRRIHKGQFNLTRLRLKIDVRPPSGMRGWRHGEANPVEGLRRPRPHLHQSPWHSHQGCSTLPLRAG